jgi:hypothetical protein
VEQILERLTLVELACFFYSMLKWNRTVIGMTQRSGCTDVRFRPSATREEGTELCRRTGDDLVLAAVQRLLTEEADFM